MSKQNKNPYVRGNYEKLFAFWQSNKRGVATRQELVAYGQTLGMSESEAEASVTVILSPRESSERGDCRGNLSAQGHVYFADPCAKVKGEDRKFRLRWRSTELEKRTRTGEAPKTKKVKAVKAKKAKGQKAVKAVKATKSTKSAKRTKKAVKAETVVASSVEASASAVAPVTDTAPAAPETAVPATAVPTVPTVPTAETTETPVS